MAKRYFSIPLHHKHGHTLVTPGNVSIPKEIEVPVFLIRHELQRRMFFNALDHAGLTDPYVISHLDHLILASLRMWDGTDATLKIYFDLMDKWSAAIDFDPDIITRRAITVYKNLVKARDAGTARGK